MGSIHEGRISSTWLTWEGAIEEDGWLEMGTNIVWVISREVATAAKASALSLQSLGT